MPLSRNLKRLSYLIAAAVIVALLAFAFRPQPLLVEVAVAARGPLQVTVEEDGELRAHDRYIVAAPVAGRLLRVDLREGDRVKAGQVLARLAPLPLSRREREEQQARVAAAEAALREAGQGARRARANLAQAERERLRTEQLVQQRFVSPQALEQASTAAQTAAAEARAADYREAAARADLRAARAALLSAEAGTRALVDLPAPVDGAVLRVAETSERVLGAGAPVLTIGDPSRYEAVVDVLSTDAVKVRPGMPVELVNWGGGEVLRGRVRTVEPGAFTKVSALGVEEQRVNIVADLVDPPGPLGDAYRVDVRIILWQDDDVLKLPSSCLFREGEGWAVFVLEGDRVKRRPLRIGRRGGAEVQVLEGLQAGERVVRHPGNALEDGARVRVE